MKAFQISSAILFSLLLFFIGCKGNQTMDSVDMKSSSVNESLDSLKDNTVVVSADTSLIDTACPDFHKVKLVYLK